MSKHSIDKILNDAFDPVNNQLRTSTDAASNTGKYSIDEILNRVFDENNKIIRVSSGGGLQVHGAEWHDIRTAPDSPDEGDLWFDTNEKKLKVWVEE